VRRSKAAVGAMVFDGVSRLHPGDVKKVGAAGRESFAGGA
jgi:hypothetical protein